MRDARHLIWSAIEPLARAHGFKSHRRTNAFLARPETTCVLNLQRSQWGEQFHVNCGVWFGRFGQQSQPKEYACHIRWRLDSLADGEAKKELVDALDLDAPFDETARITRIASAIEYYGIAPLVLCDSETNALAMVSRFPIDAFLIRGEIRHGHKQALA